MRLFRPPHAKKRTVPIVNILVIYAKQLNPVLLVKNDGILAVNRVLQMVKK